MFQHEKSAAKLRGKLSHEGRQRGLDAEHRTLLFVVSGRYDNEEEALMELQANTNEHFPASDSREANDNAPITIATERARGAGLGFETKREALRFAIAAGLGILALITVAIVTAVTA